MNSKKNLFHVWKTPHLAGWTSLHLPPRGWHVSSWRTTVSGFADALARLREHPLSEDSAHRKINESNGKTVWHCRDGTFDFAYKTQAGKKPWRYLFQDSLPVRECRHYRMLEKLGFPIPDALAVGDTRICGILRESFLVTGFLEDTCDGRIFMPGGTFHTGQESLRHTYCEGHLKLLALAHDNGLFHKAFHPRNLLFRQRENSTTLEFFWIDVARLRKMNCFNAHRAVIVDLHTFFRDMLLSKQETLALLRVYTAARKRGNIPSAEQILRNLVSFKRHLFSKKRYRLFDEDPPPN